MANTILNVVRSNVFSGDSLSLYHDTDPVATHFGLTLEDLRCSILTEFVQATKKNGVTPNTRLCLVFDSAGSAVFEKMFVLVAMEVLNVSDIHVILSDMMYDRVDSRPDMNDLPVTVEFVDSDHDMLEAVKRIRADGYQVMLNALFIQKGFFGDKLAQDMVSSQQAHVQCMNMCMPYGIYFNNTEYAVRDCATPLIHPICKDFTEYGQLILSGVFDSTLMSMLRKRRAV
jgi:hypothetical protein